MTFSHNDIKIIPIIESLQILDISDEEYFGEQYKGYISNSKLRLINPEEGGSPELYKKGLPFSVSDSFYFGSAVHELVLQPEEFMIIESVDRPTAKAGFMADELYKIYKDKKEISLEDAIRASDKIGYYKGKMNEDKYEALLSKISAYLEQRYSFEKSDTFATIPCNPIYLDPKSREKVYTCVRKVNTNTEIQELLHPKGLFAEPIVYNEATILLDVKCVTPSKDEIVLKLKGKLDNFTIDLETCTYTLNDLKTTGHLVSDFGKESFYKYHYYRQMGMYGWMLHLTNKAKYFLPNINFNCNLLLVSTIPPFDCGIYKVNNSQIQKGVSEFADLLKRVAFYELYGLG